MVQREDLMLAGAMTDPKGHRGKRPSEQADPDAFVRVVERRPDGVVIRGAKLHNTGGINSHEVLVLPGTGLIPGEEDYAIACAVPADADGVLFIFGRQSNDSRKLEGGCDIGNPRFGVVGGEAMVVFEDVFVPNERIFLNGEVGHVGTLVNYFATWHRANYGGCKGGNADVLIGATAKMTRVLGTDRNAVVKDKLVEMIHMNETTYASAIGASAMGYALPCGSFMVEPMMANTVKQNITRNVYQIGRLSHDLAGGFLATMPDEKAFENPEIGDLVRKYHTANPDYDVDERIKLGRYIENMTSVTTMVEAMHGAGSPQAQRIVMLGQAAIDEKIAMADEVHQRHRRRAGPAARRETLPPDRSDAGAAAELRVLRPGPAAGQRAGTHLHVRVHVLRRLRRAPFRRALPELRRQLRAASDPAAGTAPRASCLDRSGRQAARGVTPRTRGGSVTSWLERHPRR